MAITNPDDYADRAAGQAKKPSGTPTPAPQKTPSPVVASPPAAPAATPSATPSAQEPPQSYPRTTDPVRVPSKAMDDAAWQAYAQSHGGLITLAPDPKDEFIETEVPKTIKNSAGKEVELPGETTKVRTSNPNPRMIAVFGDRTHVFVRRPTGPNGPMSEGYVIADPGNVEPDKTGGTTPKTREEVAAESAANVNQSNASAEASRANARANTAQAQALEDKRNGILTPQEKADAALKERDQQIKEIEALATAGKLGWDVAKERATQAYQKANAAIAAANADTSRKSAMSSERSSDIRSATDLTQTVLAAKQAALQHSMSPEDAQNYADSVNRRLAQAGINATIKAPSTPVQFDPEKIARDSMSTYLNRYGATPQNPTAARTDFSYNGPDPGAAAKDVPSNIELDEDTKQTIRAAVEAARKLRAGGSPQPAQTMAAAPPGGTNGAVDDPRMGMTMPTPTAFAYRPGMPM